LKNVLGSIQERGLRSKLKHRGPGYESSYIKGQVKPRDDDTDDDDDEVNRQSRKSS